MNMPSEDYPNFFPTFIPPPPPPPRAGFFTVPPPPIFFTVLPPRKNTNSVALTVIVVVCVVSLLFGALVWWCYWNKKKHQDESNVKERDRGNKVTKMSSNKHGVYEYDKRLARSRGGLMEARWCAHDVLNTDCIYGGDLDLESGPAESYSSSDDNSNFCGDNPIVCNGINGTWDKIREEWRGNRQVTANAAKDATTIIVRDNDDTRSYNRDEEEDMAREEEEESAKNAMESNAPENDLESASFQTGPSKSSTTGKSKKGKGKGRGG